MTTTVYVPLITIRRLIVGFRARTNDVIPVTPMGLPVITSFHIYVSGHVTNVKLFDNANSHGFSGVTDRL